MRLLPVRFITFIAISLLSLHAPNSAIAQGDSGFKFLEVKVVDPDGKPLADVAVDVKIDNMEFPMPTDEEGKISLNVPSGEKSRLQLGVKHDDFVSVKMNWQGGKSMPEEYTFKLETGIPIGGLVHDEQGQPIEGVKVTTAVTHVTSSNTVELRTENLATTDGEGRWQVQTKDAPSRKLLMKLTHDSHVGLSSYGQHATWEQLKARDHVLTLKKGIELRGRITDSDGNPIFGAWVGLGGDRYMSNKKTTETDDDGIYRFGNVPEGHTVVTVVARGRAPELRTVMARREMESVDLQLQPGKTIRVLATDPDGVPVAGIGIAADNWRGHRSLPNKHYRGTTDGDGIWESNSMPADEVQFDLFSREHMSSRNNKLVAGDETHTIVMNWPVEVSGRVVDAESGLPIEKFDVVQGIDWGNNNQQVHWERYNVKQGTDGKYQTEFTEPRSGHYVRIEAPGYRPGISRMVKDDEGAVTINFELEEGSGPAGVVTTPEGKPAVGAQLFVATRDESLYFRNGREENNRRTPHATADGQGKYTLPFLEKEFALYCLHDSGWARLPGEMVEKTPDVQLQHWSVVEGTVRSGKQPLADEQLRLYFNEPHQRDAPRVHWDYQTKSDAEGKFTFDRVLSKEAVIARSVKFADMGRGGFMSSYSHSQQVALEPGQVAKVEIGGTGRAIKGQLVVPKQHGEAVLWNMGSVQLSEQTQRSATGGFFKELGRAIAGGINQRAAPQKPTFRRSYASAIDVEGRFAISDVQPGQYQMTVQLHAAPENGQHRWQPIGSLNQAVTIPELKQDNDQDSLDLGEFTLTMTNPNPPPAGRGIFLPSPAE